MTIAPHALHFESIFDSFAWNKQPTFRETTIRASCVSFRTLQETIIRKRVLQPDNRRQAVAGHGIERWQRIERAVELWFIGFNGTLGGW